MIKRDTSLNITHVYENAEPKTLTDALRSKVREVLRDHDTKKTIESNKFRLDQIVIPIDNTDNDVESIFSDKSEEITDSESDSDFQPSKSNSSASSASIKRIVMVGRTRKVPARFSPNTQQKRPRIVQSKTPRKPVEEKQNKQKFVHDKCAAWDCMRPSGALKQITWVACDDCDAWYHVSCSGLRAKDAMKENTKYHCGCG